jgi:hypothetical protein
MSFSCLGDLPQQPGWVLLPDGPSAVGVFRVPFSVPSPGSP